MPQEFQCLRCCECGTFQVHQVKKVNKWVCKLCNQKQSIIKVFGRGSGAECRHHVQKLNMMRQDVEDSSSSLPSQQPIPERPQNVDFEPDSAESKWGQYIEEEENKCEEEAASLLDNNMYTTDKETFDQERSWRRGKKRREFDSEERTWSLKRRSIERSEENRTSDVKLRPVATSYPTFTSVKMDQHGQVQSQGPAASYSVDKDSSVSTSFKNNDSENRSFVSGHMQNDIARGESLKVAQTSIKSSSLSNEKSSSKWAMFLEEKVERESEEEDEDWTGTDLRTEKNIQQCDGMMKGQFEIDDDLDDIVNDL